MAIILIILVVLIFGGGFGYYGHRTWGESNGLAGPGIGLGTIVLILAVIWLFGGFR